MDQLTNFHHFVEQVGMVADVVVETLPKIVAASAAVAAFLPHPPEGGWAHGLRQVLDFLAFNFRHASNRKPSNT